ncbi:MAG: type II secretion system F family protein, partial [Pseudomonadota bacterium]
LTVLMELSGDNPRLNDLVSQVLEKVKGGANLSDALESHGGSFSRFYLNMIRAGEAGGSLEDVLKRLADYLDRTKELRETVATALIYPAILTALALVSVFVLMTFVIPQFTEMFSTAGKELPLSTQIVIASAEWLQSYWWVLILGTIAVASYMRHQLADMSRKYVWDRRFLKIPMVGELIRNVETAGFSRTLGTLLGNGVSLLKALSIVKETIGNRVLVEKVAFAEESLKNGREMSAALIESGQFPKMAMQMIKLGEETGRLEEMLQRVAVTYDKEIKNTIQRLLALLEPVLILGLGLIIGGIMVSILMAIMSVNDLAF